jgi:hypothetical protein
MMPQYLSLRQTAEKYVVGIFLGRNMGRNSWQYTTSGIIANQKVNFESGYFDSATIGVPLGYQTTEELRQSKPAAILPCDPKKSVEIAGDYGALK